MFEGKISSMSAGCEIRLSNSRIVSRFWKTVSQN